MIRILIFLFFIFTPFFILAEEKSVLINEITWMGTMDSANKEWIELYNNSSQSIDFAGWSLQARDGQPIIYLEGEVAPNSYFLLERTNDDTVLGKIAKQIYTGALGNTGEYLELFDKNENRVDFVDMSGGWSYGDNVTKQTMERVDEHSWQTSENVGGSPGEKNILVIDEFLDETIFEEELEEVIDSQRSSSGGTNNVNYSYSDILINEIYSAPVASETEWVEFYNTKNTSINLDDWYVVEGSGSKTILNGIILANSLFVLENPKGNLNNAGDIVFLYSPEGTLIDKMAYGDWEEEGNISNPPAPRASQSLARENHNNTSNYFVDFKISETPTKGSANIIFSEEEAFLEELESFDYGKTVVVSEVFPDPIGDDREGEFIELYNYGDRDIFLFGWRLGDLSQKQFTFKKEDKIKAKSYLVVYRPDSGIALNNSGDAVKIFLPEEEEPFYVLEYGKAEEGFSFNNAKIGEIHTLYNKDFNKSHWVWSDQVTPGAKNVFKLVNNAPEVDFSFSDNLFTGVSIIFDSSDTYDPDGDELTYSWDFGDGFKNTLANPGHTYLSSGEFLVSLEVSDGKDKTKKEKTLNIKNSLSLNTNAIYKNVDEIKSTNAKIYISEILPNPEGDDLEGEFIEIYNYGEHPIDLFAFIFDDMEGGSKSYKIEANHIIDARDFFVLNRTESKIVLNNTYDKARIFDSENNLIDEVEYQTTFNSKSYARDENGDWFWTENVTPGSENIREEIEKSNLENKAYITEANEDYNEDYYVSITPSEVQSHGAGQTVLVEGVVNSLPNMFSSQYFYIEGDGGVQIYSNKKDYPDLRIGDYIQVKGEISKINNESRVKTKSKEDIFILDRDYILTADVANGEFSENNIGKLISLEGELVEKNGSKFIIYSEGDNYLFEIKDGTKIDKKNLKEGDLLKLSGILSTNKDSYIIFPRFEEDIEHLEILPDNDSGEVLGEFIEESEWTLPQKNSDINKYLLVIIFLQFFIMIFFLMRKKEVE